MALVAAVAAFSAACAENQKPAARPAGTPVQLQTATKQQLVEAYNAQAKAIHSINATISIKLTAGTQYSGVIKQYHQVNGFILAQEPSSVRVIGQAPIVGTNIFDMVSDGETFHIFIPSKNKFLEGPATLQKESAKPIENLRPQHLTEALFWSPIAEGAPVLFEAGDESNARYYVLTVVQSAGVAASSSGEWLVARGVWFDRADLSIARLQVYDTSGNVISDVRYSQWDTFGSVRFARDIQVTRPEDDYSLEIEVKKMTANEPVSPDRFVLKQPPGSELVKVGEDSKESQP
ncbi:MAG TPA: hypothetical protein VMH00_06435 [Candidatus Limnocylindrales bacterium]|nr:hypothetical protein [Candidatus Limnocylindrales bacterium]